jgi:hypothetical protein
LIHQHLYGIEEYPIKRDGIPYLISLIIIYDPLFDIQQDLRISHEVFHKIMEDYPTQAMYSFIRDWGKHINPIDKESQVDYEKGEKDHFLQMTPNSL